MINANELRLGNWLYDLSQKPFQVTPDIKKRTQYMSKGLVQFTAVRNTITVAH